MILYTCAFALGQDKKLCGYVYLTYPKFLPLTLNFSLQILKLEEKWQNKIILFWYSLPASEFGEKIHIKMTIWNGNLNFYAIGLVLKVKGLKCYIIKNRHSYISFVLSNTFPSRSEYSKKKVFKKIVSFLPTLIL